MDLIGRALGDFTVEALLAQGGQATVYRARQRALGRDAVIKVLPAAGGDAETRRFLREAHLASRLDHPYAAHVYAFGAEPDGLLWIAMERVDGTTLRQVLEAQPGGRLPLARLVPLIERVCEVVHTAHERGIVHRDLKPDNIMVLSRAGRLLPKLLDLGVAHLVTAERTPDEAAAIVGSPCYMAPELWIPGAEVDARSDVYALGALTYEALAGHVPFDGSLPEVARGHARGELPRLPGGLPGALDDVLARALAKAAEARYPGALAFAEALRAASGLRMPPDVLPRLDDALRADTAWMPQPIAGAIAAFEAARNPHQARDALWAIVRSIARWLGALALAARSQLGAGATGDPEAVLAALRALARRDLSDPEWLELVRALTAPFAQVRDAYPIPELIDLAAAEPSPFGPLFELRAREAATTSEETLRDRLAHMLPVLAPLLRAVAFLTAYPLVVPRGDRGELWMGPQRQPRPAIAIAGDLPAEPVLVDLDGRPLLSLAPLVQIAAPSPGAPEEVFVLAGGGRGRGGAARLVADPLGFERHDETVWDWLRAHVAAIDGGDAAAVERVPYRGLAAFTEDDADVFFGRERETQGFVNRLIVEPLLAVVGPSGAGKSSFVRAGVVPALPPGWRAVVLRPGPAPMTALAAHLERTAAPGETAVIVVDQFEELFTLCRDPAERQRFAAALADAAIPGGRCRVVLTVRDDFLAQAGELAAFRDRLSRGVALLPVPGDDDLRRVIVEPARRAGYDFDDADLPAQMVRAVRGRPGALALISFTARQLWDLRDRQFQRLTCRAYDAIGGVEGALARHAEDTLRACSGEEQQLVRAAFRHLVTAAGTRAVLTRDELDHVLGRTRTAAAVVERLVDARLVVVAEVDGREQVEVVHEALLTAWPRLVDWRRDDVEGARLRDQVRAAARQWDERGRPRGLLWRDDALDDLARWRSRWPGVLPEVDQAFCDASVRDARRGRRIRRALAAVATVLVVAGLTSLSVLYRTAQRSAAVARDRAIASYIDQGRHYLLDADYLRALPYLAAAYTDGDRSNALRFMLHRALALASPPVFRHPGFSHVAAFRHGDREVMSIGEDGDAAIWDATTGRTLRTLAAPRDRIPYATAGAITRDGELAAILARDVVWLWDGETVRTLPAAGARRLAFDATGRRLAFASRDELTVWDVATGQRQWSAALPDGAVQLVWSGDAVVVLDARNQAHRADSRGRRTLGRAIRLAAGAAGAVALIDAGRVEVDGPVGDKVAELAIQDPLWAVFSADDRRIAIAGQSGAVALYDVASGRLDGSLIGHDRHVQQMMFSRDGARLVTAGIDQTVRVWDLASHAELVRYVGLGSDPNSIRMSASGDAVLVTAVGDHAFPLEDPAVRTGIDAGGPLGIGSFTVDGSIFATTETGVTLWDATGRPVSRLAVHVYDGAHLSRDGSLAAIPIDGTTAAEVRELRTGALRARLESSAAIFSARFAFDGRIVTSSETGLVEIWDPGGRRLAALAGHTAAVDATTLSADDRRIASASRDRSARVWDVATGRELARVTHNDEVLMASFDAAGERLVTASSDGTVGLWDVATSRRLQAFAHRRGVLAAAIDRSGSLVAAATNDGTISLWDVEKAQELARFHHGAKATSAEFGAAGLLTTSRDHRAIVWDIASDVPDPSSVAAFVRCHVPYELRDARLVPVVPSDCSRGAAVTAAGDVTASGSQ